MRNSRKKQLYIYLPTLGATYIRHSSMKHVHLSW